MKNLYTLTGRTTHKKHETIRSYVSGFGKAMLLFCLLTFFTSKLDAQCTHSIQLTDTYGDGWNGGRVSVSVGGVTVLTNLGSTFTTGVTGPTFTFTASTGQTIRVWKTANGTYPTEMRVRVFNNAGTNIAGLNVVNPGTGTATSGGLTGNAACAVVVVQNTVPSTGNNSYTLCSGVLYDHAGSAGNYAASVNGYTVINPSIVGNMVRLTGNITTEANYDYVRIFNGVGTAGTLLYQGSGTVSIGTITSTSGPLTVQFTSDGSVEYAGFALNIACIAIVPVIPLCAATPTAPANGATGVAVSPTLSWAAVANATGYDVYFGTANPATTLVSTNQAGLTYAPTGLLGNTTYYWKIVPRSSAGSAAGCATWSFVTTVPGCGSAAAFGSGPAPAPGTTTQLTTCAFAGEYSTITGVPAATTFTSTGTGGSGNYITIRKTTSAGTIIAAGFSPLTWTSTGADTYVQIVNTNSACGTESACHTLSVSQAAVPPTITSFTPTSACGSGVSFVITGTNFTGATAVNINGLAVATFTVNSATQITAITATVNTTGLVSVVTAGGTATSTTFTVYALPVITAQPTTPASFCGGSGTATLSVTATGATSYQWNKNGVNISAAPYSGFTSNTLTITNPSVAENGAVLTCVITGAGGCTVTTSSQVVTVGANPATPNPVTATNSTICGGESSLLNATSAGNYINWYTAASGGTLLTTVPSATNYTVTPSATTTYYAEAVTVNIGSPTTQTFNYTGAAQTFTVPAGVTSITLDMSGAKGGNQSAAGSTGGSGGRVQATYPVTPGQVLNLYVGGASTSTTGGFNGGGTGPTSSAANGGGGGGSSDIRIGGTALSNRVLVAGGGGGAGLNCSSAQEWGGTGGGLTGGTGWQCNQQISYVGVGGSQSAGGATGTLSPGTVGTLGTGGNGYAFYGGGGGGGYYGGGGGSYGGGGGGSSFSDASATSVTHTQGYMAGNGQILITYTPVTPGCVSTTRQAVTVTVNTAPTANAGAALTGICAGSPSAAMGGSVGGSATGGTWSGGAGTWTNANNPSTATYTAGASETGTITLTLTTTGGGCTAATVTKSIVVSAAPTVNAGTDATLCPSQTTVLNGTSNMSDSYVYTLTMNDSWGDGWNGGYLTAFINGTASGTYAATGTGSSATINITPGQTLYFTYTGGAYENENSYTIALNGTTVYTGGPNPATGTVYTNNSHPQTVVYAWTPATALSSSSVLTPTCSATGTTTYTLTVTKNGCSSTDQVLVTVLSGGNAGVLSGTQTACIGATTTFTSNGTAGGTWSSSNAGVASVNASTGVISGVVAGSATITYTIAGSGGCPDATATRAVTVSTAPTVNAGTDVSICPLESATLAPSQVNCSSLSCLLTAINANQATLLASIPTPYGFVLDAGVNSNSIGDGGNDMYDGGNYLNTNLGASINYSDNTVVANGAFGTGGQYFTRAIGNQAYSATAPTVFYWAADLNGVSSVNISGNNGADGSGTQDLNSFNVSANGVTYSCFLKRVYGAFDPSINHLFMIPQANSATQSMGATTDDDLHTISSLTGVTRMYYMLYSGNAGATISVPQATTIAQTFANIIPVDGTYSWTSSPTGFTSSVSAPTVTPSATTTYTLTGTLNGCSASDAVLVTVASPTLATAPATGDMIWKGATNTDWGTLNNWWEYNGSAYVSATAAPTTLKNVIIPANQSCVLNQPNTFANSGNAKDLKIEAGATLTMGNGTLVVNGNWINNGVFNAGTGTVQFGGAINTTIGGSAASNNFNNVEINKSGDAMLISPATIAGSLTLTNGNLNIEGYTLDMGSQVINGGSATSYVKTIGSGVLKRNVSSSPVVFPVGKSSYNPATLTNTGTADDFSVRVYDYVSTTGVEGGAQTTGQVVNRTWMVSEALTGGSDVMLKMQWNTGEELNGFVYSPGFMNVNHHNGSVWEELGVLNESNSPSFYVEQSGISSFSPFTIGITGSALPIELISFQANCAGNKQVEVTWSTASEHNTSHFVVEKSRDGVNWTTLNTLGAAGNSTSIIEYALTDNNVASGTTYYRLTQFDLDGASETFNIASANCGEQAATSNLVTYPNPSNGSFYLDFYTQDLTGPSSISVFDSRGVIIYRQDVLVEKGSNVFHIEKMDAAPGMYYIQVSNGTTTSYIVKHSLR